MLKSQRLLVERSERAQKANALLGKDSLTDEERAELDGHTKRLNEIETEYRAAVTVEAASENETTRTLDAGEDAEARERRELRAKCQVSRYLDAAMRGRRVDGAEAELSVTGGIPFELFEPAERRVETRADAPTPAPTPWE